LFLVLMVSGCAGMRGPVSGDDRLKIKDIGVLSLLGNKFSGIYLGFTVFTNEHYTAYPVGWDIDQVAVDSVIANLSGNGKFSLQQIFIEDDQIDTLYEDLNRPRLDEVKTMEYARGKAIDTLVVVRRTHYDNAPYHESPFGYYERFNRGCVYSLFIVQVFDVKTGSSLGWEWAFPCLQREETLTWKESFDLYSASEQQQIKKKVENSVREGVTNALKAMTLTN